MTTRPLRWGRSGPILLLIGALAACSNGSGAPELTDEEHRTEIEDYRAAREERLRGETGWLSLVGLHWLEAGENRIGSAEDNEIVLPAEVAPDVAGTIHYDGESARLVASVSSGILHEGDTVTDLVLTEGGELTLGRLRFSLIERTGRHAIRVKDPESPVRTGFDGLDYYPIDPAYRVVARLEPYDPPRELDVATVVGAPARFLVPGRLVFELDGESIALDPLISAPTDADLFLVFKDGTSGKETYGAGRYLYATLEGDRAVVDFNRAYNPPCAFTPFATCPLPPPGNRIDAPIEAGEKIFEASH